MEDEYMVVFTYEERYKPYTSAMKYKVLNKDAWEKLCEISEYKDVEKLSLALDLNLIKVISIDNIGGFEDIGNVGYTQMSFVHTVRQLAQKKDE